MDKKEVVRISSNFLIEVLLIGIGVYGIIINFTGTGFMGNGSLLLYFTIQSNIAIIAITTIFLILKTIKLKYEKKIISNWLLIIKFIFTVGITITFLVFFVLLAPTMPLEYLLSMENLTVHFLVPLFAIVDFFFFDNHIKLHKVMPLVGTIFPLLYLGFVFLCIALNITFNGQLVPYFFLNYEELTWFNFTSKGPGVLYWILVLLVFVIILCYLFYLIIYLINKRRKKHENNR